MVVEMKKVLLGVVSPEHGTAQILSLTFTLTPTKYVIVRAVTPGSINFY